MIWANWYHEQNKNRKIVISMLLVSSLDICKSPGDKVELDCWGIGDDGPCGPHSAQRHARCLGTCKRANARKIWFWEKGHCKPLVPSQAACLNSSQVQPMLHKSSDKLTTRSMSQSPNYLNTKLMMTSHERGWSDEDQATSWTSTRLYWPPQFQGPCLPSDNHWTGQEALAVQCPGTTEYFWRSRQSTVTSCLQYPQK